MIIDYKDKIKPGDAIVVYNKKSWLHRIIVKVTGSGKPYRAGHAAVYLGEETIAEANSSGVALKKWKNYTSGTHLVYIVRHASMDSQKLGLVRDFAEAAANAPYAFLQLPVLLFKYLFRLPSVPDVSRKAMICSEFVCAAYRAAGINLAPGKNCAEITPVDIILSDNVEVIDGFTI